MAEDPANGKETLDIGRALEGIAEAAQPYPPAALFALSHEGYSSLFEVLIGCVLSVRTRDEDLIPVARNLFARARTPAEFAGLTVGEIDALIAGSTFHEAKAPQIRAIAAAAVEAGGELPCDEDALLALPGVGPKCANLALGIACGAEKAPHAAVDTHVHRVTNRWGYVEAATPEKTMMALDSVLPLRYRVEINRLLVPFGKHVCTAPAPPRCSTCPVLAMCRQVGVTRHQ